MMMKTAPKYENLTDNTTLEYGMSKELNEVHTELTNLAQAVKDLDLSIVGRMKKEAIGWEDIAKELEVLRERIENTTDYILEKFDQGVDKMNVSMFVMQMMVTQNAVRCMQQSLEREKKKKEEEEKKKKGIDK